MKLDIDRLATDITDLEERIRAVKIPLRRTWTEPMDHLQGQLLALAAEVTALYTLRAWVRGRLHRTQPPRPLRDAYRDMGLTLSWDAKQHNRTEAERAAERYRLAEDERTPGSGRASASASIAS